MGGHISMPLKVHVYGVIDACKDKASHVGTDSGVPTRSYEASDLSYVRIFTTGKNQFSVTKYFVELHFTHRQAVELLAISSAVDAHDTAHSVVNAGVLCDTTQADLSDYELSLRVKQDRKKPAPTTTSPASLT